MKNVLCVFIHHIAKNENISPCRKGLSFSSNIEATGYMNAVTLLWLYREVLPYWKIFFLMMITHEIHPTFSIFSCTITYE